MSQRRSSTECHFGLCCATSRAEPPQQAGVDHVIENWMRLLTDRRPTIDDHVGDRGVVAFGLPGHGGRCVALRRTDTAGRPNALVRPAELLRFPAALGLDRPAPFRGLFNTPRSRAYCSLYNTRTPRAVHFPSVQMRGY